MSTLYTYYDTQSSGWRNRLAQGDPFPMAYPNLTTAIEDGRELAKLFEARHLVISPAGLEHVVSEAGSAGG